MIDNKLIAVDRSMPHAVLSSTSTPSTNYYFKLMCLLLQTLGSQPHYDPHSTFSLQH